MGSKDGPQLAFRTASTSSCVGGGDAIAQAVRDHCGYRRTQPALAAAVRQAHPVSASMHITKEGHHERRAFGTAGHHCGERVRLAGIGTDTGRTPTRTSSPGHGRVPGRVQSRRTGRVQHGHGALPFLRLAAGDRRLQGDRAHRSRLRHGALGPSHGDPRQPVHLARPSLGAASRQRRRGPRCGAGRGTEEQARAGLCRCRRCLRARARREASSRAHEGLRRRHGVGHGRAIPTTPRPRSCRR